MALLDLLGRRWLLRVLWELRAAPLTFRALRTASGDLSPTVLSARLADLRAAGLVNATPNGYVLTAHGKSLLDALDPLNAWAAAWGRRTSSR
jgi:DNA-binding HxlR family transcriptional regulator